MFWTRKPQVFVVGAGPVGLFSALVLAKKGIPVQIVDRASGTGAHSYALALHQASLNLFEQVGLREKVLDQAFRVRSVGIYDAQGRRASLPLHDLKEDFSFVCVLKQESLENLLEEALAETGVKVQWNHEVSELEAGREQVRLRLDRLETDSRGYGVAHAETTISRTTEIDVPFVIGADGYHSDVRRWLGIGFDEIESARPFVVFEFRCGTSVGDELRIVLQDGLTSVLWPMTERRCRWSFELDAGAGWARQKDSFPGDADSGGDYRLDEAYLRDLLARRAPWFNAPVEKIIWRRLVSFERRVAASFGRGRVWLAGDAGHVTGPAGMQSMNVGLREAAELADALAKVTQGRAPASLLEKYGEDRQNEWHCLLGIEGAPEVIGEPDPWIVRYRHRLLECLPASGQDLEHLARHIGLVPRKAVTPGAVLA
jgi:2-polyprenyl-6-methoxyphenol hydroxylase-like FAD-dependent oxidoreductase